MSNQKHKSPIIFLAFANERTDSGFLRNLTGEMKSIMKALKPAVKKDRCFIEASPAATAEEIREVFQDEWYDERIKIFHYGGHADQDELWLETESGGNKSFFSLGLAHFLAAQQIGGQQGLNLVFLNACATKAHADLLIEAGIPVVIATSVKIDDNMAYEFAETFYHGIAGGASIEEAYYEAQGMILGSYNPDNFKLESGTRSLYWEDDTDIDLDLPWQMYPREDKEKTSLPKQWRLFYELKDLQEGESLEAKAFVNETINNYKIEKLLGEGSLGAVYKAQHINLNEERAIRITHHISEGYDLLKQIIFAGNKGLGSINHPNVVDFHDVGEVILRGEKRLYMVMEFVRGTPLDKLEDFQRRDILETKEKLTDLVVQICAGLEAAHKTKFTDEAGMAREGIIHGNLKTRKIFYTPDGIPKLNDFLFTDLTRSRNIKLSLPPSVEERDKSERPENFFAPELLNGSSQANKLTDIYSLGAVLFHFLTGEYLVDFDFRTKDDLHQKIRKHVNFIPKNISEAIYLATRPDPQARIQSVGEVITLVLKKTSFFKRVVYWFKRK